MCCKPEIATYLIGIRDFCKSGHFGDEEPQEKSPAPQFPRQATFTWVIASRLLKLKARLRILSGVLERGPYLVGQAKLFNHSSWETSGVVRSTEIADSF